MKNRIKAIPLLLASVICVSIAIATTLFLIMNNIGIGVPANTEVELRIEWHLTEGKYLPINVSAGDILYGKSGEVHVKIEEVKEEAKQKHYIIKDAKGIVLKGEDKVEVGMELHLVENPKELITIPEASIPSIKVKDLRLKS